MEILQALALCALLFGLLGLGISVAITLVIVGILGLFFLSNAPIGPVVSTAIWGSTTIWTLAALPLFIWMGEILFRTRLSEDMFRGLTPWVNRLPGGLLHVNNVGSGIFAAVSGSSAVTAATIGKISLSELRSRGYPDRLAVGTLAGAATLGFLIPPSVPLIVYGVGAEVSIARLFIGGLVPAAIILALFMILTGVWSKLRGDMPKEVDNYTWRQKLKALLLLLPVLGLMVAVIGSIYAGWATPTESAAVGVLGALVMSLAGGSLTWNTFAQSLMGAARTTCMIGFIVGGATVLTVMFNYTGIPLTLAKAVAALDLNPYLFMFVLTAIYLVLGCVLEGISIMVLSAAIFVPVVSAMGFDLIWFGIYLVIIIEMALITPPIGFNLFVIQQISGRDILFISAAALPFFATLLFATALIVVFPELVLWLPDLMMR
ncbi:TRAP transporter large permease [Acuticoccus yangtzensis]|uniref:TRAP transporter large permease n=1 Tax=Acuticoccus yangtzensis TaxID=1443441 RepID=UPI0009499243|nr:TRAP transporter large permease subunit [Acuticoccus yangtzensis]ORE90899.1 TRAP dicarboxylate transporter subunit DctM [Stappia sp. 22II-S9-Z10]